MMSKLTERVLISTLVEVSSLNDIHLSVLMKLMEIIEVYIQKLLEMISKSFYYISLSPIGHGQWLTYI